MNQRTITSDSYVLQHHSPKRMKDKMSERLNASHPPHHLINRANIGREPHAHTPCVYMRL